MRLTFSGSDMRTDGLLCHWRSTWQVEATTSAEELLNEATEYGDELKLGTMDSRTPKDLVLNIQLASELARLWNAIRCYLHAGQSRRGLSEGTPLLIANCQSRIMPGRPDTVAYLPYPPI